MKDIQEMVRLAQTIQRMREQLEELASQKIDGEDFTLYSFFESWGDDTDSDNDFCDMVRLLVKGEDATTAEIERRIAERKAPRPEPTARDIWCNNKLIAIVTET